jgi:hypothetical protein
MPLRKPGEPIKVSRSATHAQAFGLAQGECKLSTGWFGVPELRRHRRLGSAAGAMRALPANRKGSSNLLLKRGFPFSPADFGMHVDAIPAALASRDMGTIKEALAALASLPP